MNVHDAETMLTTLSKSTKKMIGEEVLSLPVPNPNEIWATVVAINSKLNAIQSHVQTLGQAVSAESAAKYQRRTR